MHTRQFVAFLFLLLMTLCTINCDNGQERGGGPLTELEIINLAKKIIEEKEVWPGHAVYEAQRINGKWEVRVARVNSYDANGNPVTVFGGDRFIYIDENGNTIAYHKGR